MGFKDQAIPESPFLLTAERKPVSLPEEVKMMQSNIELLLDTLADLSDSNLQKFKKMLLREIHLHKLYSDMPQRLLKDADVQDTVFLMVDTYGDKSVSKTKNVLIKMGIPDLGERIFAIESRSKEIPYQSGLILKVGKTAVVKNLLSEALRGLSEEDFRVLKWFLQFTYFVKGLPQIPWNELVMADKTEIVDQMVKMCGQQSLEVAARILKDVNRDDLVLRLPECSLGSEVNEDDTWPALNQKVEDMKCLIGCLWETLAHLSDGEFEDFKHNLLVQISSQKCYPAFHWEVVMMTNLQDTVLLTVQTYDQCSLEKTVDLLKKMNRTDLVQRLSESSAGTKEKLSGDKLGSALIQKVATMAAVKPLLLEALCDLSNEELKIFNRFLWSKSERNLSQVSSKLMSSANRTKIVDVMVEELGQQAVKVTREALMYLNRTDVLQMNPQSFSGLKDKKYVDEKAAALLLIEKEMKSGLLETLTRLTQKELEKFRWLLQFTFVVKGLPQIPKYRLEHADSPFRLASLMVGRLGQESVKVAMEVFTDMQRGDLVTKLSRSNLSSKEWYSASAREETATPEMSYLLEIFEDLSLKDLEHFKWLLMTRSDGKIPKSRLEMVGRLELVELMVEAYGQQTVKVTLEVLSAMNFADLVQKLSDISMASEGASSSSVAEGPASVTEQSSIWTKVEPEVNDTAAGEDTTYRLQSAAGHFECSVSGLRWVCKEEVGLMYQFCSWEGHMERIKSRQYSPAGPLMDVTLIAGKINEVLLPHWVCIDDIPNLLETFKVLHINDSGEVLETVSEVTPSHVRLTEPDFSSLAALVSSIFRVKVSCDMLIYYQPHATFLKLRLYLIPLDSGLKEAVKKSESSSGFERIKKHRPDKHLKMHQGFSLNATVDTVKVQPKKITLRYDSPDPNCYEVLMKNPDREFSLELRKSSSPNDDPVWICEFWESDYPKSGPSKVKPAGEAPNVGTAAPGESVSAAAGGTKEEEEHFVDKHSDELIARVSNIGPILDFLKKKHVIQQEAFNTIKALPTTEAKMREIYSGPLRAGKECKDLFYAILLKKEPRLIKDLRKKK